MEKIFVSRLIYFTPTLFWILTWIDNMNWAKVLIAGVILVVFIDWVLRARHCYYGN